MFRIVSNPQFLESLQGTLKAGVAPTPSTGQAETTPYQTAPKPTRTFKGARNIFRPTSYSATTPRVDPLDPVASGGQSTRKIFGSTLREAERRARIQGRSLRPETTKAIGSSWFGQASERLATEKGLQLQERGQDIAQRGQDIQKALGFAGLESAERQFAGQVRLAKKQIKMEKKKIASAEEMFKNGLISQKELTELKLASAERMNQLQVDAQIKAAEIGAKEQKRATEGTGGFFGRGGFLGTGCIIISACTSPTSYEVNIARQYRDQYMDVITRAGYYGLSEVIVPFIHRYRPFKRFLKKWLVGSIVDHSECVLGHKSAPRSLVSAPVMINFLRLCRLIGCCMTSQRVLYRVWTHL